MNIKEALLNEEVSYKEFYEALRDLEIGEWDLIHTTETIFDYINDKMREGIRVSHMLIAIEENYSKFDHWAIWLGNSSETPRPINSKEELVEALNIYSRDLERKIML